MMSFQKEYAYISDLMQAAPAEARAFLEFKQVAERQDGQIPQKYRELIALAVALSRQCPYCLDQHVRLALQAGASTAELAETVFISSAVNAGAVAGYGLLAMGLQRQHQAGSDLGCA